MEPIIELKNLSKTFGDGSNQVAALQNVNIAVQKGEIFGIIGLSGAGKSTLVRCINLLERPDQGEVLFHGKNLMTVSEKELRQQRKKITMIFQHFNLLDQRTSLENICFPLELVGTPRKEARARAMELLETVGLPDKRDADPVQLSGGQKQRIAIARALATNPEVLLCDEATSALDPKTTREQISSMTLIWWVMTTTVTPRERFSSFSSSRMETVVVGSRAEVASSHSSTSGSDARARAMAMRCF